MAFLNRVFAFVKKEVVFFIALLCAVISMFFVPPSKAYLSYVDWNTIFLLFALMGVVAAFRSCGIFERMGNFLCNRVKSLRALVFVLVMLPFFFSMLITNDVALLTFVPLTFVMLSGARQGWIVMLTVILQTVAANTGSMLTPLGNPQNLFLFGNMSVSFFSFVLTLLPYTLLSFVVLSLCVFFVPKSLAVSIKPSGVAVHGSALKTVVYLLVFVFCLLSVVRLVPKWSAALLVLFALLVFDRKILLGIDYMLLLTFMAFFVFTGNIASIGSVKDFLSSAVSGNEFFASLAASQVISNVPAALLLYPFCPQSAKELLFGVNIGGLGTLVASLASLISFKIYSAEKSKSQLPSSGKYLLVFTVVNVAFLALEILLKVLLSGFAARQ